MENNPYKYKYHIHHNNYNKKPPTPPKTNHGITSHKHRKY